MPTLDELWGEAERRYAAYKEALPKRYCPYCGSEVLCGETPEARRLWDSYLDAVEAWQAAFRDAVA